MKKFRQRILEMKEGFLDAKWESRLPAFVLTNVIVIGAVYWLVCYSSMIFLLYDLDYVSYTITIIASLVVAIFLFYEKAFVMILPFSISILLHFFGRYGRVVTKADWTNIKRKCPKGYKDIWSKKCIGHCYYYSWEIALFLENAELMYCSVKRRDGTKTAHAVIVKNNCVYCTNARRHYEIEEYKKLFDVEVYKMFSEEEYRDKKFFENIREDFKKWCVERNVYCNPQ